MDVHTRRIDEAVQFLIRKEVIHADIGIVLGTGFGGFADTLDTIFHIPFADVPHFAAPTVEGHAGRLIYATYGARRLIVMQGRLHRYEGYSAAQIAFPLEVMRQIGVSILILTNAAGALNPLFKVGDFMIVEDHITGLPGSCSSESSGLREAVRYDPNLNRTFLDVAVARGQVIRQGVLAWMAGPSLETRAEIGMLRQFGADAVTMSTVPEACIAGALGMRVAALSCISNQCFGAQTPVDIADVAHAVSAAADRFSGLMRGVISTI